MRGIRLALIGALAIAFPNFPQVYAKEYRSREVAREFKGSIRARPPGRPAALAPATGRITLCRWSVADPTLSRTSNGKPSPPRRPRTVGNARRAAVS
jgi:hypothetical protein